MVLGLHFQKLSTAEEGTFFSICTLQKNLTGHGCVSKLTCSVALGQITANKKTAKIGVVITLPIPTMYVNSCPLLPPCATIGIHRTDATSMIKTKTLPWKQIKE